jgi:hypothetical protein
MAVAALGISLAAVLIALGSLVFTRRADRRAARAEERAERADRREVEARLEVTSLGGRSSGDGSTAHVYSVLNASKVAAHALRAWLVDEGTGEQAHEDVPGPGVTLLPLEEKNVEIRTHRDVADLRLVLVWTDGAGEHIETRDSQGGRLPYRLPDVRRPEI